MSIHTNYQGFEYGFEYAMALLRDGTACPIHLARGRGYEDAQRSSRSSRH